jgi:hypothetical protein
MCVLPVQFKIKPALMRIQYVWEDRNELEPHGMRSDVCVTC